MATLIAHWDFDGPTDKSGNGHTLIHGSGATSFGRPITLNGLSPHYFDVPTLLTLPNTFSLAVDMVLYSHNTGQALLALNQSSGYENCLLIGLYGANFERRLRTTNPTNFPSENLPLNTRFQFVLTFQAQGTTTAQKVYVNGYEVPSAAYTHPELLAPELTARPFTIGQEWDSSGRSDFANVTFYEVKVYNGVMTPQEITDFSAGKDAMSICSQPVTAIPANQEPRSQFQPQDVAWRGTPPLYPGPVNRQQQTKSPLCKGRDYYWIRDGVRNVEQGFIESTVTINGQGVRRRVLCFDQAGNLIGETMSRASDGKYRFDLLWLSRRYMLVAQDDPAFGPADYNAVAADFQQPTPYAPGEGVGLPA